MSEPLPDAPSFIRRYLWRLRLGTALLVIVSVVVLGFVWFFFIRAPSPNALCDHVADLRRSFPADAPGLAKAITPMADGGGAQPMSPSTHQQCTWHFTTEQKQRGFFGYGQLARCVSDAQSPSALYSCL